MHKAEEALGELAIERKRRQKVEEAVSGWLVHSEADAVHTFISSSDSSRAADLSASVCTTASISIPRMSLSQQDFGRFLVCWRRNAIARERGMQN